MTQIRLLAAEVADAIAAGEVIERPASVIKELVENALDAGARRVSVDVVGAGRTSIRVSDDGAGIHGEELPLAFMRHATSKVATLADLETISSLGFRGEALASIAAVADVTCQSGGARLRIRAGELVERGAAPITSGTTFEVRDLFANVPARLKFLKSNATEVAAIKDVMNAYAVLHHDVRFELTIEGRKVLSSPGDGSARRALAAVHGQNVAAEMLEIASDQLRGMVSQPRLSRGSRDAIVLAVNRRPIVSRSLSFALEDCYQGRLERGRHPIAAIDITIDPSLVDVNVHPSKREVRFREESAIFSVLQRAVRAALDGSSPYRYRPTQTVEAAPLQTMPLITHEARAVLAPWTAAVAEAQHTGVLRPIGQAGPGYLVAEGPDGIVFVDQHAAHERILYNRLLDDLRSGKGMSQPLLMPQAIDVEPAMMAAAANHKAELAAMGLELEEFGPRSLRITAVPAQLPAGRATEAVLETLAALADSRGDGATESAAASLACHSAVKFGDVLDLAEQRRLLADLETASEGVTCPHGRPTRLVMEWQDIKRHFRRNY